jgi:hypothetical protein
MQRTSENIYIDVNAFKMWVLLSTAYAALPALMYMLIEIEPLLSG